MAIVYDAASGRLVRETDAERMKREAEQRRAQTAGGTTTTTGTKGRVTQNPLTNMYAAAPIGPRTPPKPPKPDETPALSTPRVNPAAANTFASIRELENAIRSGNTQQLEAIRNLYAPQVEYGQSAQTAELAELDRLINQSRGQIDSATAEYLQNLTPTTAFQNVPLVALEAEENPLLEALATQGAGTTEIESQRGLDTALANQLRALSERSAGQYGATESAFVDALRRSAQGAQAAGLQGLAASGVRQRQDIGSRYADYLNQLRTSQLEAETRVSSNLQDQLMKIAEERARAVGRYGPPPKKKVTLPAPPKSGKPKAPKASAF